MGGKVRRHRSSRMLTSLGVAGLGIVGLWAAGAAATELTGEASPGLERVEGPVPALLVRVEDAATLVVQARPWPRMTILTTVRIEGAAVPPDPTDAALRRLILETRLMAGPQPIFLHAVRPSGAGSHMLARVTTADGLEIR